MRIQRTTTEWAAIIAEQKESGTTIAAYCQEHGIHPNVFYRKQKQLQRDGQTFIRVQHISRTGGTGTIRIGEIEIEARENMADDFLVRMIRCAMEAGNADVFR